MQQIHLGPVTAGYQLPIYFIYVMFRNMENTTADPNSNNNIVRNWLSGIGAALVAIVVITYALHRSDTMPVIAGAEATSTTSASSTASLADQNMFPTAEGTRTTGSMGETVTISNQPAGRSVTISDMTIARKSWVAVKDTSGSILGAALFAAGTTSGTVPLLRATRAGERYEALIYVDNGDKMFNLRKDLLVSAADGSPGSPP